MSFQTQRLGQEYAQIQASMQRAEPKRLPLGDERFRYVHDSFLGAGVDNFSSPPGQNPLLFTQLNNVLPAMQGGLQRRWGYKLFSSPAFVPQHLYEFQSDVTNQRQLILAGPSTISAINEDGTSFNSSIITPNATAPQVPRIVMSRSYAYFYDKYAADLKKWDGSSSGGTSAWGIGTGGATATGVTAGGTAADDSSVGSIAWANPSNAKVTDSTYATATVTSGNLSHGLKITNFGFTISTSAPVYGIEVSLTGHTNLSKAVGTLYLVRGGNYIASSAKSFFLPLTSDATVTVGGATDLWGQTILGSDIVSSTFGVMFVGGSAATYSIDSIKIKVYSESALTVGAPTAGHDVTLTVGRIYYVIFKNSTTGHLSDLSGASSSSGPVSASQIALSNIPTSSDTQVDRKILLATADGGDETTLYYLDEIANATTTYTDNTPELTLLSNNIYQETDQFGALHGVANNTPPPNGSIFYKHRGRFFAISGQVLYFSKSIDELTTSTSTICGKWEESWPADYFFDVSEGADNPRALFSDGEILYIGTERAIKRLIGTTPTDFIEPDIVFSEVGVLNQECWQRVFVEGTPSGTIWMTPDFRLILSDMNTYRDIGWAIQTTLNTINPAAATTAVSAIYAGTGQFDLYILAIPTGSNTVADTLCIYNLRTDRWFIWTPTDKVEGQLFNINASGIPQILFGAESGKLYRWGTGLSGITRETQDRVSNTPVSFTSTAQTVWLDFGDPIMRKQFNELEIITGDSALTTQIEGASTNAQFTTPNSVDSGVTLTVGPFGELKGFFAQDRAADRFYRFTFTSTGTAIDLINSWSVEVNAIHNL